VRNRWVCKFVTKTSSAWPPMHMLRKGNIKTWYNHQHDTIVFIAFLLCHKTQKKDTIVLNVLCVHKTQQKVLNDLFLMTQAWMFSCFIPPLARNSVVEPCNGLFAADDYLETCWACLILNMSYLEFLSSEQEKSRKQDKQARCFMQVKCFCLKLGACNSPKVPSQQQCSCYS